MATFTTTTDRFPYNTTVTVYPQSNWSTGALPPSGAPVGSSTTSAVVSSASVLTFTGLTAGTAYFMTAEVDGAYRYVGFRTQATSGQVLTENGREEQSALVIPKYDKDNGQAGMYATPGGADTVGTQALVANQAYFSRFVPSRDMTIDTMVFSVSSASGTNDPCDVGIYDSTLGTRIVSSGATSDKLNAGSGRKEVGISATTLAAGTVYYAAFAANSTATIVTSTMGTANAVGLFGTGAGTAEYLIKTSSYVLPTSIATPTANAVGVLLALLEA